MAPFPLSVPPFKKFLKICFRATVLKADVWTNLSKNWDHFFWLTGETPDTLQILINRLHNRINLCRRRGRLSPISKRNQVINIYINFFTEKLSLTSGVFVFPNVKINFKAIRYVWDSTQNN